MKPFAELRSRRRFVSAATLIVAISLGTTLLDRGGFFDRYESASLDQLLRLGPRNQPDDALVVRIDDADYAQLFGHRSPLDAGALSKIIDAISLAHPREIVVDLLTDDRAFGKLSPTPDWPTIVWAQDALDSPGGEKPLAILGGRGPRPGDYAGLARMPTDDDGVIRRYARTWPTQDGARPTLPHEAVLRSRGLAAGSDATDDGEEFLNFAGRRWNYTAPGYRASQVLALARYPAWRDNPVFHGKIVVIGGYYREARDTFVTSVGLRQGVDVITQAIETEIHGNGIKPVNEALAFALDVILGFALVAFGDFLRTPRALLLGFAALAAIVLLASYATFETFGRWFNFVPMIAGVVLHELYHHGCEYERLLAERDQRDVRQRPDAAVAPPRPAAADGEDSALATPS